MAIEMLALVPALIILYLANYTEKNKELRILTKVLLSLMVVMVMISILVGMAMQIYHGFVVRARAADVIGDMNVIKVAVLTYQSDHNGWPSDGDRGRIPPELEEYLPEGFSFQKEDYVLDYDNWSGRRRSPFTVGVTVITRDEPLGFWVLDMLGSNIWSNGSRKYTWIIDA